MTLVPHDERRVWTPARMAELRQLRADGLSLSRCAERLGKSRGAVVGALHREANPAAPKRDFPVGAAVGMIDVARAVADAYGVSVPDLKRSHGGHRVSEARYVAIYMSRRAGATCAAISRFFCLVDGHAYQACRTVIERRKGALFDGALIRLEAEIDRLSPETTTQERFQ